jgi:signal transduction histidine kinase/CheY-like chemotaxis protein
MPGMDGYMLCKEIKAREKLKDIPVMLLTSLSNPQDVVKGLYCGADSFLRKPYDEKYLLSRIEYILANRELQQEAGSQVGLEVYLSGERHFITAERQQILGLLISTYEDAVYVNEALNERQKELARSNEWLNGLYRMAEGLNRSTSERDIVEQALQRVMELPGIQAGWILLQEGASDFRIAAARGLPPALSEPGMLQGDCVCRRKLISGELNQAINVLECDLPAANEGGRGRQGHACVPLWIGGRTLGILNLVGLEQEFSDEDLKILYGVGNQIGVALERARLYEDLERKVEERTAALRAEIRERERTEEALRKAHKELEAKVKEVEKRNKETEDFVYAISHDLKSPLVSIQGFASEVRRAFTDRLGEEGVFYFNRIIDNANQLENLVHGLLDLSRVERMDTHMEEVDMANLVRSVLERLDYQIKTKGIRITIPKELPVVTANYAKMDRVLANLISNAIAYIGSPPHPHIEINGRAAGEGWLFYVRDNGMGIPKEYHQKVFNIFERLPEAKKTNPKGTGAGLAIVKRIVEFHGGTIWVESEPGQGSTFYFTLATKQSKTESTGIRAGHE